MSAKEEFKVGEIGNCSDKVGEWGEFPRRVEGGGKFSSKLLLVERAMLRNNFVRIH
jgi:hypothetical protein